MKSQVFHSDLTDENIGFKDVKDALLKAVGTAENPKHPVKRVEYKITLYWK
jgi:hypothetical protein